MPYGTPMASIKAHRLRWKATVRIPKALEAHHGGRKFLYRSLPTSDRRAAQLEADAWEVALRLEWASLLGNPAPDRASLREMYGSLLQRAEHGELAVYADGEDDPVAAGIGYEIDRMADAIGERDLTSPEAIRLAALQDAAAHRAGRKVKRRAELELTFKELADEHLKLWRIQAGLKDTNTERQKVATFDLFASFYGERPIREVTRADASQFVDALRQLDPNWARTGKAKEATKAMTWAELQRAFGGRSSGLSDATVNRHMATLSALWRWGEERDHCTGRNPFDGHRRKLKEGRNKKGYTAWEPKELEALFSPPPKRDDLTEVMLVAMFTGMRLNEIVSLTYDRIVTHDGVQCIDVSDAKTTAGVRLVPLHPRIRWLAGRAKATGGAARVWPKFTGEGPGRKPGGDAGKEFSRFKAALGYTDRRKVFHSFRKNVVGQLERAGVPQNEVAQLVGHEKQGMTFGVYGSAMSLQRLADIVALIDYPGLVLPEPALAQRRDAESGGIIPPNPN